MKINLINSKLKIHKLYKIKIMIFKDKLIT